MTHAPPETHSGQFSPESWNPSRSFLQWDDNWKVASTGTARKRMYFTAATLCSCLNHTELNPGFGELSLLELPSSSTEKRNDLIPHCEVTDSLFRDGVDKIRCRVFLPTPGGYHSNTSGYQPEPVAAQRYLWLCRHLWWSSSVWVILSLLLCQTVIPLPIPTNFPLQPSHSSLLATTFRTL